MYFLINYIFNLWCVYFLCLAATFFCSYELTKNLLKPRTSSTMFPFVHMFAATVGEVVSSFPCYFLMQLDQEHTLAYLKTYLYKYLIYIFLFECEAS